MITWTQSEKAIISVGVYDAAGKLVKTVLGGKELPVGTHSVTWDGTDNVDFPVPAGTYSWKVIKNGNTYSEGIQLGNTGFPTTTAGIVPSFPEGVAIDAAGDVYTVNGWDEAHRDVIKWSGVTGLAMFNTGHIISDRTLEGIAVEPDGSIAYVAGVYGNRLDIASECKMSINKIDLVSRYHTIDGYGRDSLLVPFTSGGRIDIYNADTSYPVGFTAADKSTASIPIRSLALNGNTIYAPDSLGSRVLMINKTTGAMTQISNVPIACSIAIDGSGNIWVGASHSTVRVYNSSGTLLGTPITSGPQEIRALAIAGNVLYVADDTASQIRKYTISGATATFVSIFGRPMVPGDRVNDALAGGRALATDSSGNLFIADRPGDGRRLQKLSPSFTLIWIQFCLEFSSTSSYSKDNPTILWTSRQRAYQINQSTGAWNYLGLGRTDTDGVYFGNFNGGDKGPPRVVSLNGQDFFYMPTVANGVGIYRVIPSSDPSTKGPSIKLASCISAAGPLPDGNVPVEGHPGSEYEYLWSWDDDMSAAPTPATVDIYYSPSDVPYGFTTTGTNVDDQGRLWLGVSNHWFPLIPAYSTPEKGSVWVITPTFNSHGSPVYKWEDAVKVVGNDAIRTAFALQPSEQAGIGLTSYSNGMIYAFGSTNKAGTVQDPDLHSGGNILMGFKEATPGTLQTFSAPTWKILLKSYSAGLALAHGGAGGVFIGYNPQLAIVHHYDKDGLLLKAFAPGPSLTGSYNTDGGWDWVSGRLDSLQCLQADRAPDGKIDVFSQDNLNQRIVWYRIDDTHVSQIATGSETIGSGNFGTHYDLVVNGGIGSGKYLAGATVQIRADDPILSDAPYSPKDGPSKITNGKVFIGWTGQITDTNAITSFTMPSSGATVTANYKWPGGSDKIRFMPGDTPANIDRSVWEGANSSSGPWTVFYDIPEGIVVPTGWNEVIVDFGGARYLRWRKRMPWNEGVIVDLEWIRNGVKVTGVGFGSPATNSDLTFDKALDSNPSTRFNWADTGQLGAHVGIIDDQIVAAVSQINTRNKRASVIGLDAHSRIIFPNKGT